MKFPISLCDDRFEVRRIFSDGGGMGIILDAIDTRCANNRVLIKTTRYDAGPRARNLRYTAQEALDFVSATRKILEWERKVLVRFRNDGLNNIPSANHFFTARSLTLEAEQEGKLGGYELPESFLREEPFLVLEYIQGDILESRMHSPDFRARLDENVLSLAREILTIFIRLHKETTIGSAKGQFIYQDLKPANVLVSDEDYFTLIDFGGCTLRLHGKTTEPTAGCITPGYAGPEASDGNEAFIDSRFDLYTLGSTMWHVVTRSDPREMGEFPLLDMKRVRGEVSPGVARIIEKALQRDPDSRYQTAAEMRREVIEALRNLRT